MPFKMLFDSFRYLNRLPRYEDSKLRRRWRENREWDPMTRIFFLEMCTMSFQNIECYVFLRITSIISGIEIDR